jgi:hypothetical protein
VRLEKKDRPHEHSPAGGRRIRWLAAKDGLVLGEFRLEETGGIFELERLFSDGRRVYGLASVHPARHNAKVFVMEFGR